MRACHLVLSFFNEKGNPPVSHVTYSPNGKYILAGTLDSKLRLWNVGQRGSNKCTKTYETHGNDQLHVNNKYCIVSGFLTCRPDRQCIITGSETGKIILYDINSRKVHQVLQGHTDAVLAVDAHDSQELIASGGMTLDKTVQFWAPSSYLASHLKRSKR
jgi:COMPASS component SWD3